MNKDIYKAYMSSGQILYTIHDHCVSYDMIVDFMGVPKILNVQIEDSKEHASLHWGKESALDDAIKELNKQKKTAMILIDDETIRTIVKLLARQIADTFRYPSPEHTARFADTTVKYIKMEV